MSLQYMLQEHGLEVDLAESGEQALDHLKKHKADVVFMDHTMPGMDGLEAVSLIKANPETATIPVMMYTTKEGEVYVGQARALGAVGVMPKNVQKHQIFEMLLKLGLVQDRRAPEAAPDAMQSEDDALNRQLEDQALGISVQSLVGRMLEDQHLTLRSDILRSQKAFAKDVAREVLKEHLALLEDPAPESVEAVEPAATDNRVNPLIAGALVVALVVAGFLAFQFKSQRDSALDQVSSLRGSQAAVAGQEPPAAADADGAAVLGSSSVEIAAGVLPALEWSANEGNFVALHAEPFSPQLADKIRSLVAHLERIGFSGEIRLTSHLGRFCLREDGGGNYLMASADAGMIDCDRVGHPLDGSTYVSDRLSVEFADLLLDDPAPGITLNLVALDDAQSQPYIDYPDAGATAGEWNAVALLNNRVEVELLAGTSAEDEIP